MKRKLIQGVPKFKTILNEKMELETKVKHTPTPYLLPLRAVHRGPEDDSDVLDNEGTFVFCGLSREQAEFIVRAVNSHEALLEAGKEFADHLYTEGHIDKYHRVQSLIDQTEGGK